MNEQRGRRRSAASPIDVGAGRRGDARYARGAGYAALAEALEARDGEILVACQERYLETLGGIDDEAWLLDPLWNVTSLGTLSIVRWLQTGELANLKDRSTIASVGLAAAYQRKLVAREFAVTLEPTGLGAGRREVAPPAGVDLAGAITSVARNGRRSEGTGDVPGTPDGTDMSATAAGDRPRRKGSQGIAHLSVAMLTKLNFWWSEVTCQVLAHEGRRLGVDPSIVDEATVMVVKSSQASLVDMAKRFDAEIESLHKRLTDLALHDPLTGLANRMVLVDQLDRALARLARSAGGLALVFVDLDDFKAVNDVYGHAFGDAVLREVASRLTASVRPGDVVARLGGDEFVLLFEALPNPAIEGQRRAERVRAAASQPISVDGHEVRITVSAGVATVRLPGRRSEDVLAEADRAMYGAKRAGRNRVAVVEVDDQPHTVHFATTSGLHQALERNELRLVYQPVCDSLEGTVVAFEALLRWEHPEQGTVPPLEFIPIAEESGLMVAIGEWVLGEACRQAMAWAPAMGGAPRMAVNVSARQLDDRDFVRRVTRILERTGMPPGSLMLEITETVLLGEDSNHEATLSVLKDLGVLLAIDDFGTGYSSLAYLRRFPVDQLKVDRSFVKDVADHGDTRIMKAVVRLAHDLGLEVVAEGVETSDELSVVQGLGCDVVQGYLLGRPVPPAAIDVASVRAASATA
ncbi:MAG: putative bifunctional diguanylate cyclase/phosphodiesterase [Acidimicrobiales bacterium]